VELLSVLVPSLASVLVLVLVLALNMRVIVVVIEADNLADRAAVYSSVADTAGAAHSGIPGKVGYMHDLNHCHCYAHDGPGLGFEAGTDADLSDADVHFDLKKV
jgi:hypothetical protein